MLGAAVLAVGVAEVQARLTRGGVAYAWAQVGYVLAVVVGMLAVVWETQAALALADFAPQGVGRRACILLAAGLYATVPGWAVLVFSADGVAGRFALGLVVASSVASAAGLSILLVTRGADYAARKIDERAEEEW